MTHTHPQPPAIWGRAWFGFFAPPSAYTVQLLFGYTLIPAACAGNRIPLITLSTLAFVVAVAAVIVSWGEWRTLTRKGEAMAFLALLGGVMGPIFVLLIAMTGIATGVLEACPL